MSTLIPYVITTYADRLDQICVRRYGASDDDVVIYVMNANPGIERFGIVLPPNLRVLLPDLPVSANIIPVVKNQLPWV